MVNIQAGRDLDALVAEKVMGFRREKVPPDCDGNYGGKDVLVPPLTDHETWKYPSRGRIALTFFVPHYSTDISATWEVVEKLEHLHPNISYCDTTCIWTVFFWKVGEHKSATADTAPLAICLAALKAIENAHNPL